MKKIFSLMLILAVIGTTAWQYRIELLVWGAPRIRDTFSPVHDNRPTQWPAGPSIPIASPDERPPNIILILAQAEPLWPSVMRSPQLIDKHGGQEYEEGDEYLYWPN